MSDPYSPRRLACVVLAMATLLGACQVERNQASGVTGEAAAFRSSSLDTVVGADCVPGSNAGAVRLGMNECELVRALGRPQDVVVSDLPDGRKRVSMFYAGSGGTTRSYTFVAGKLISTPPGALKENYAGRR